MDSDFRFQFQKSMVYPPIGFLIDLYIIIIIYKLNNNVIHKLFPLIFTSYPSKLKLKSEI